MSHRILLTALAGAIAAAAPLHAQTEIRAGQTITGTLSSSDSQLVDGSYYDLYTLEGQAGEFIRITMRSGDFDAYLAVEQGSDSDFEFSVTDDDGAGGTDSELEITLPRSGEYLIHANSLSAQETGSYSLAVVGQRSQADASVPEIIREMLDSATVLMAGNGLSPRTGILHRSVADGGSVEIPVRVESGGALAFVGVCGVNCTDLDLEVFDPSGRSVGSDYLPDDAPIVIVESSRPGTYRLRFSMADCAASRCDLGGQVYGQ